MVAHAIKNQGLCVAVWSALGLCVTLLKCFVAFGLHLKRVQLVLKINKRHGDSASQQAPFLSQYQINLPCIISPDHIAPGETVTLDSAWMFPFTFFLCLPYVGSK